MTKDERAVIEAARRCFAKTQDMETGRVWLASAVCTWMAEPLADAIRRLDGLPPYGNRQETVERVP